MWSLKCRGLEILPFRYADAELIATDLAHPTS
jgi:hypothetical protein